MTDGVSPDLDAARARRLLELARAAIAARLNREPPPYAPAGHDRRGVFVSLHGLGDGALRGCVGCFRGEGGLERTVLRMAVQSAFHDPRFSPLASAELDGLAIEISVLSVPEPVTASEEIEVGRDGLIVSRGGSRGVLLPQVAVEHDWDVPTFLAHTCRKAGLDVDAWREPETRIERFTAQVLSEPTPD